MEKWEVEKKVMKCIERVAQEQSIPLKQIKPSDRVVEDLGFQSLDVGTLTAFLEMEFKIDPFTAGIAVVTEIRTVQEVCDLYFRCVNGTTEGPKPDAGGNSSDERLQRRMRQKRAS